MLASQTSSSCCSRSRIASHSTCLPRQCETRIARIIACSLKCAVGLPLPVSLVIDSSSSQLIVSGAFTVTQANPFIAITARLWQTYATALLRRKTSVPEITSRKCYIATTVKFFKCSPLHRGFHRISFSKYVPVSL